MKILLSIFCLYIVIVSCTQQKKAYELPAEMLAHVRPEYEKRCEKGYYLYRANCAGCHDITYKRKQYSPDFSADQLQGYSLRISNARHESAMPDSLVSEEELALICNFLAYKKPNPDPVKALLQNRGISAMSGK